MTRKLTNLLAVLIAFCLTTQTQGSFRQSEVAGFEIGNGSSGLDTGGFEIGNGREIIELINLLGAHSIKLYKDFDFQINGESTWATGLLAGGAARATLELAVKRDLSIPTLANFILKGLKAHDGALVKVGNLQGFRKDTFDEASKTYSVDLALHVAEGILLTLDVKSGLEGLKEIQAIADSVKIFIN